MNDSDTQRLNKIKESVARVSQWWLLCELKEESNSPTYYIRNLEILRCLIQNGMIVCF